MVKTVVTGAGGRMGGKIISLISTTEGISVVAAVEITGHPIVGRDIGQGSDWVRRAFWHAIN